MLKFAVRMYRCHKKDIDWLKKKKEQFDESFCIREVAAKYDVTYETFKDCIHGAQERHEAHTGAQRLTPQQEKMIAFQLNQTKPNCI